MNTLNNKNILKTCRIYDLEDKPKFLHNGIYYDKSKYIELYKALLETHNVVKLNKFYLSAQKHYLKNSNELNKLELDIITLFFSENSLSIPKIENKKSKNIILAFMLSSLITIILIALIALAFFDIAPRVNNHDETVEVIEKDDGSLTLPLCHIQKILLPTFILWQFPQTQMANREFHEMLLILYLAIE